MDGDLIVYSTYYLSSQVRAEIARMQMAGMPLVVSCDEALPPLPDTLTFRPDVSSLEYMRNRTLWMNIECHMILLRRHMPHVRRFWYVEHDIRYTGDWSEFFRQTDRSDADLLATWLDQRSDKNAGWCWWGHAPPNCRELWSAFIPIWRISAQAIDLLDRQYRAGRIGYCETAVPSLLVETGMPIADLRDCGIPYGRETFTWLPKPQSVAYNLARPNTLFHPVRTV